MSDLKSITAVKFLGLMHAVYHLFSLKWVVISGCKQELSTFFLHRMPSYGYSQPQERSQRDIDNTEIKMI